MGVGLLSRHFRHNTNRWKYPQVLVKKSTCVSRTVVSHLATLLGILKLHYTLAHWLGLGPKKYLLRLRKIYSGFKK